MSGEYPALRVPLAFVGSITTPHSFRRQRFNWPSDVPESRMELDSSNEPTPKSPSFRTSTGSNSSGDSSGYPSSTSGPVYKRDELTHVRTLRVFEAFKIDERALS